MTIQDLGSIGELVAAIATIATLAYLAVQVRQNTRSLRSSAFQAIFQLMVLRRLESLYMQRVLGALDSVMSTGFERSVISTLTSGGGAEWWQIAKNAFTPEFAAHIDAELASGVHAPLHPGFGRK